MKIVGNENRKLKKLILIYFISEIMKIQTVFNFVKNFKQITF